jgi:hypothetical protein
MMPPYRLEICDDRRLIKSFKSRTPFMAIHVGDIIPPDEEMPKTMLLVTRVQHHIYGLPGEPYHVVTVNTEAVR